MAGADDSLLSLDGFEVLPDTPASMRGVQLEDFTEAAPLQERYCEAMLSADDYEREGCSETEKALQDLIKDLEADPSVFLKILRKRKKDELEDRGIYSLFKSRIMQKLKGKSYLEKMVSEQDLMDKLDEVKTGMLMAFNYAKENKSQRFSQRLLEKRMKKQTARTPTKAPMAPPPPPPPPPPPQAPPPPPPCPPPVLNSPLADVSNVKSLLRPELPKRNKPVDRTDSLRSVHDELEASNPLKRLRSTETPRSPGGTPLTKRRSFDGLMATPNGLRNMGESLASFMYRQFEAKFQNVRSPSPAPNAGNVMDNTLDNSVQGGFTP